jgi:formate/nitrite transporter FocA (FNT family)
VDETMMVWTVAIGAGAFVAFCTTAALDTFQTNEELEWDGWLRNIVVGVAVGFGLTIGVAKLAGVL